MPSHRQDTTARRSTASANAAPPPATGLPLDSRLLATLALATGLALAPAVRAQPASPAATTPPSATSPAATASAGATARSSTGTAGTAGESKVSRSDRRFLEEALKSSNAEIAMGRLAERLATDAQVRAYGLRMVADHQQAGEQLSPLARLRGVTTPEPDRGQQRDAERLGKLTGAEFDRAFMKQMVEDHRKSVKEFERAAKDAEDAEIKALAARMLPTLQGHLQQAQALNDSLGERKK